MKRLLQIITHIIVRQPVKNNNVLSTNKTLPGINPLNWVQWLLAQYRHQHPWLFYEEQSWTTKLVSIFSPCWIAPKTKAKHNVKTVNMMLPHPHTGWHTAASWLQQVMVHGCFHTFGRFSGQFGKVSKDSALGKIYRHVLSATGNWLKQLRVCVTAFEHINTPLLHGYTSQWH